MTNKKADQLLQKANTYEKLALFGNRKNFLAAIAQEVRVVFPSAALSDALKPVEAKLQSVIRQVSQQAPQNPGIANLQQALNGLGNLMQPAYVTAFADLKSKVEAMATQLMNVRSGAYSLSRAPELQADMKSYLVQLGDESSKAYDIMTQDPSVAKVMQTQTQTDNQLPVGQDTTHSTNHGTNSVPKDIQEKLSEMLSIRGDFMPFAADGILGPKTQQAFKIYQEKYNNGSEFPPGDQLYNRIRKSYNFWQMNNLNQSKT